MGIKYTHKYTYCIKNLTIDQIFLISSNQLEQTHIDNDTTCTIPCIDIDCSLIIRGYANGPIECRIQYLVKLSSFFIQSGFEVHLICNGTQHHLKGVTIKRQTEYQQKNRTCYI
jgi:hypothetical protein